MSVVRTSVRCMGEVSSAVDAIVAAVAELQAAAVDELSHREIVAELTRLTAVAWTLPAVEHRLLGRLVAETEPARLGEASWPKVLTTALRVSSKEAKRRLREARNLGPRRAMTGQPLAPVWEATAAAQARGALGPEHVEVITRFHTQLPGWVDVGTRTAADAQLADLGAGLGPEELRVVAGRLLAMIDQDGPEPSEDEHARKRGLVLGPQQRDGMSRISGYLTPEARATWEAIFAKWAAPGMCNPDDQTPCVDGDPRDQKATDTRSQAQRNHDAFTAAGRAVLASGALGVHNGLPVTVIVSTTLQQLQAGAGVAVTGGGSLVPIPTLIRMAAHAHHYLYVYDTHTSESLYLGRSKRCASAAQRIVLHARDRGCSRPGCTVCGYNCQVHHAVADWKNGGHTNIDDLTFACGPDNRLIANTAWTTSKNTQGHTEWIPPPDLDTGRNRLNGYHHPQRHLLPDNDEGP